MARAVAATSRPSQARNRNACCWRRAARAAPVEAPGRAPEREPLRGTGGGIGHRVDRIAFLSVAPEPGAHAVAHPLAPIPVADTALQDGVEERRPVPLPRDPRSAWQLQHGVLREVERLVAQPITISAMRKSARLDARRKRSSARWWSRTPTPRCGGSKRAPFRSRSRGDDRNGRGGARRGGQAVRPSGRPSRRSRSAHRSKPRSSARALR